MNSIRIGKRIVGPDQPCFIIAEAGVNHNGSFELAKELVRSAAAAGADAVKFQTFVPELIVVSDAPKAEYQLQTTSSSESQIEMLSKLTLTDDDFKELSRYSEQCGIVFLSTGCAPRDIEFLVTLGVLALKVASMDIVNYPFLSYIGRQRLPVLVATGMATLGEVETGLQVLRDAGCENVALLHCVSNYPVNDNDANLRVISTLAHAFQVPVGYSDHTRGVAVPIAASALGACIIEKHFTLDKQMPGPDHLSSLNPQEFKTMVDGVRAVESALGSPVKRPLVAELSNRVTMRRSIVAAANLPSGTVLSPRDVCMKRPGTGLGAEFIPILMGRRTAAQIPKDAQLNLGNTFNP